MRFFRIWVLGILVLTFWYSDTFCQEDNSKVYEETNKSVVLISYEGEGKYAGSGIIVGQLINGEALVLTAYHVVQEYDTVIVSFGIEELNYKGLVSKIYYSETEDIALVIVRNPPVNIDIMKFRESVVKKGTGVGAIGHPQDQNYIWSGGEISDIIGKYLFHSAALEAGSSGGPLLDNCGRMVGINVAIIKVATEQDTVLAVGSNVTLSTNFIVPTIEGWFNNIQLKKIWKYKKYCSKLDHITKNPLFLIPEGIVVVGILGCQLKWWCPDNKSSPIFGEPNPPPGN